MNDEMDAYLERCIKNWAARHQPPEDGRARLLEMAASPPEQRQRRIASLISWLKGWYSNPSQVFVYEKNEWTIGHAAQSRIWFSHMTANWRPVH